MLMVIFGIALANLRSACWVVDKYGGTDPLLTITICLKRPGDVPFGTKLTEPKSSATKMAPWLPHRDPLGRYFQGTVSHRGSAGREKDSFQTSGAFLFSEMGHVPLCARTFGWNNSRFEIVDIDGKQMNKVLVSGR